MHGNYDHDGITLVNKKAAKGAGVGSTHLLLGESPLQFRNVLN